MKRTCPEIESALSLFTYELMDKYISDLISAGKFNEDTLQYVDLKKSNSLLNNLPLSPNKQAVLEQAFLTCPFNDSIYEKCAEYDLSDDETLATSKKYYVKSIEIRSEEVVSVVKDEVSEIKEESEQEMPKKKADVRYDIITGILKCVYIGFASVAIIGFVSVAGSYIFTYDNQPFSMFLVVICAMISLVVFAIFKGR